MRRLLTLVARLYPEAWRKRYGDEFSALMEQLEPNWKIVFDTAQGALTMQLRKPGLVALSLMFAIAGALLAAGIAWSRPSQYRSQAVLLIRADGRPVSADRESELMGHLLPRVLSRKSLADLIVRLNLYEDSRRTEPMEAVVEGMRQSIHIGSTATGRATELSFDYPDNARAQATLAMLIQRVLDENVRIRSSATLEMVDPPTYPHRSLPGKSVQIMAQGLVGGALLGAAAGWWRGRRSA